MPEWVGAPERDMKGWGLGGRPGLSLDKEEDGQDFDLDSFSKTVHKACATTSSGIKMQGDKINPVVLVANEERGDWKKIILLKKAMSSQRSQSWSTKGWKEYPVWKLGPGGTGGSRRSKIIHETGLLNKRKVSIGA